MSQRLEQTASFCFFETFLMAFTSAKFSTEQERILTPLSCGSYHIYKNYKIELKPKYLVG